MNPVVLRYLYRTGLCYLFINMTVHGILGEVVAAFTNLGLFVALLWIYRRQRLRRVF